MERHNCSSSRSWGSNPTGRLPAALQLHILSLLPPNERALSGRLVSPEARDDLGGPQHCTASLSQPLPRYAASWAQEAGQQHVRQLPFKHKVYVLCTAAASGSEVNLEVAFTLLQPSIFAELLQTPKPCYYSSAADPGVAAVKAGHPQLLGWLLRHCPGLLDATSVLEAAAWHCDLAGLQAAWGSLQGAGGPRSSSSSSIGSSPPSAVVLGQSVLDAAAGSVTSDAVAKMQWVLEARGDSCSLRASTAEAAMRSGDLVRLRWLRQHGCPIYPGTTDGLWRVLGAARLAVAQWLVDEPGCELPATGNGPVNSARLWTDLLVRSVQGPDAVAKLRWLGERGAPSLDGGADGADLLPRLAEAAAEAGQVEVVQHMLERFGPARVVGCLRVDEVAGSGSVPMLDCLAEAGASFTPSAYAVAAIYGYVSVIEWLATVECVPAERDGIEVDLDEFLEDWPTRALAQDRDLLQAVQLLVGVARCRDWNPEYALECAAARGNLALLQLLQEHQPNYLLGDREVAAAVRAGCEALLEWILQHPGWLEKQQWRHNSKHFREPEWDSAALYVDAAENGDRGMLAALRRLGVPWGAEDVVVQAVREGGCMAAVRWLVEQGAPVGSRDGMETAIEGRGQQGQAVGAKDVAWLRGLVSGGDGSG